LWTIPERLRVSVREVCIDMREGYVSAVKIVLPQERIVADRFHVAKNYFNGCILISKAIVSSVCEPQDMGTCHASS
jgi:hypothetical protein